MKSKGTALVLLILFFAVGAGAGYYYGSNSQAGSKVIIRDSADSADGLELDKKNRIERELDLLKSYTDFVLLPPENIPDPVGYAEEMGNKVKNLNDDEITAKFYATGETENKEQKIIDFLDFLNDKIKAELQ